MADMLHDQPTLGDPMPPVRTAACERCGEPIEPPDRFCSACGGRQQSPLPRAKALDAGAQKYFRCTSCGAEVAIDPSQRSYTCAFCDSNYVLEFNPEQTGRQSPEFVIGFAVPPEKALVRFRAWLKSNSWFRPGDLAMARIEGKLRGVYIPFWSFSMLAQSQWAAQIGEYWYRTETYTVVENGKTVTKTRRVQETEWWDLSGQHHEYYSAYLVSGSRGLSQPDAERIKPFHLAALKRYEPHYLAGWLSEEYSIERDDALTLCQQEFRRMEQDAVAGFLPGDTHAHLDVQTQFSHVGSDLILLPIYILSYRYRDRVYRYLLNGQTGKDSGDKPVSWWRIGLTAVVAVALVAAVAIALRLLMH